MVEWRPCVGFPRHEVNDLGQVRHRQRKQLLRPSRTYNGQFVVCLYAPGKGSRNAYIGRLVAEAFMGPAPVYITKTGRKYPALVYHKDGDPSNNRVDNLYWGSMYVAKSHRACGSHKDHLVGRKDLPGAIEHLLKEGFNTIEIARILKYSHFHVTITIRNHGLNHLTGPRGPQPRSRRPAA